MLMDLRENVKNYLGISKKIDKALNILQNEDFINMQDGKYEIDQDIYYFVGRYETKTEWNPFEAHRKYLDIQYVVQGKETIGYKDNHSLDIEKEYCEENDYMLYKMPDCFNKLMLSKGSFCIFWPNDAHSPGYAYDKPEKVCKIVLKIKL